MNSELQQIYDSISSVAYWCDILTWVITWAVLHPFIERILKNFLPFLKEWYEFAPRERFLKASNSLNWRLYGSITTELEDDLTAYHQESDIKIIIRRSINFSDIKQELYPHKKIKQIPLRTLSNIQKNCLLPVLQEIQKTKEIKEKTFANLLPKIHTDYGRHNDYCGVMSIKITTKDYTIEEDDYIFLDYGHIIIPMPQKSKTGKLYIYKDKIQYSVSKLLLCFKYFNADNQDLSPLSDKQILNKLSIVYDKILTDVFKFYHINIKEKTPKIKKKVINADKYKLSDIKI